MKVNLSINLETSPSEIRDGLAAIMADFPERFARGADVTFTSSPWLRGYRVTQDVMGVNISFRRNIEAFRAIGRLLGKDDCITSEYGEDSRFDTIGIMIDCSRNGVPTLATVKTFLRRCALMGINMMHLYTEDTYEVPGEPFFGYLRGRYTYDELKEIDDYAFALGIEMIPCIQTLGHLDQILQWPAYRDSEDADGVLLVENDATYALLEKMIAAASAPFRSKRINLGMDEAFGIGTGKYKTLHGEQNQLELLNNHIIRMRDICAKHGLRPMIWGDMYFCFASPSKEYYNKDVSFPEGFGDKIPKDVDIVYWDYYHDKVEFYEEWIDRYRALGIDPPFNCSAWTHVRFWAALPYAFTMIGAGMTAARNKGLREVMISLWGDDGNEVDYFSALPAMQLFTEYCYADRIDMDRVKRNFRGSCGVDMDGFVTGSKIDYFAFRSEGKTMFSNHGKWLLWQDTLLGLMDPQVEDFDLRSYYKHLAEELEAAQVGGLTEHLKLPEHIARVLTYKTHLRRDLKAAYLANDKAKLRAIVDGDLAQLRREVDALWKYHRELWFATFKPFGWEVLEQRYGGLRARLESLTDRLNAYLAGEIESIPELEQEHLRIWDAPPESLWVLRPRVVTPSFIK